MRGEDGYSARWGVVEEGEVRVETITMRVTFLGFVEAQMKDGFDKQ